MNYVSWQQEHDKGQWRTRHFQLYNVDWNDTVTINYNLSNKTWSTTEWKKMNQELLTTSARADMIKLLVTRTGGEVPFYNFTTHGDPREIGKAQRQKTKVIYAQWDENRYFSASH